MSARLDGRRRSDAIDWTDLHAPMLDCLARGMRQPAIAAHLGVGYSVLCRYMSSQGLRAPKTGRPKGTRNSRPMPPGWLANVKAGLKASAKHAARMEAMRGTKRSPEVCAAISAGKRAAFARRRAAAAVQPYRGIAASTGLNGTCGRRGVPVSSQASAHV